MNIVGSAANRIVLASSPPGGYNPGMAKNPKKPVTATESSRKQAVLYLRLTSDHVAALEEYISRQRAKPDRQAVGLAALEAFLKEEKLWPRENPRG